MSFWATGFWADGFWAEEFWEEGAGAPPASFSLVPSHVNALGAVEIVATGVDTDWGASDPFTVVSGPATMVPASYTNVSATSASFYIDVSALGGLIVISDSDSGTTFTISAGRPGSMMRRRRGR